MRSGTAAPGRRSRSPKTSSPSGAGFAGGQREGGRKMDIQRSGSQPFDSAEMVRRNFLKIAGAAALAFPAIIRARADAPPTKRQEFTMDIKRNGSQPSGKGPAEYFTGTVR